MLFFAFEIQEKFKDSFKDSGEMGKKIFSKTTTTIKETFVQSREAAGKKIILLDKH